MNLAVLKYEFVEDAPEGIPLQWPAEIKEIGSGTTLPGENWVLMTTQEFQRHKDDYQQDYDDWLSGYDPSAPKVVADRIRSAMDFGKTIMIEYATSNVLAGLTTSEVQEIIQRTMNLQLALNSGALYVAIEELNLLVPDALITEQKITEFRNKIESYLGLPLT